MMVGAALLNIVDQTAPQKQRDCRQQLHFHRTAMLTATKLKTSIWNESIGQNTSSLSNSKHWCTTSSLYQVAKTNMQKHHTHS